MMALDASRIVRFRAGRACHPLMRFCLPSGDWLPSGASAPLRYHRSPRSHCLPPPAFLVLARPPECTALVRSNMKLNIVPSVMFQRSSQNTRRYAARSHEHGRTSIRRHVAIHVGTPTRHRNAVLWMAHVQDTLGGCSGAVNMARPPLTVAATP